MLPARSATRLLFNWRSTIEMLLDDRDAAADAGQAA
jgi:hypothetical protein